MERDSVFTVEGASVSEKADMSNGVGRLRIADCVERRVHRRCMKVDDRDVHSWPRERRADDGIWRGYGYCGTRPGDTRYRDGESAAGASDVSVPAAQYVVHQV